MHTENQDICEECGFEGLPFVPMVDGFCPRCGGALTRVDVDLDEPPPAAARPAPKATTVRLSYRSPGGYLFEVGDERAGWAWIEDPTGKILRWGNVTTGHEPDARTRKILEAAHFVWTISGEPPPPWEWVIPEVEGAAETAGESPHRPPPDVPGWYHPSWYGHELDTLYTDERGDYMVDASKPREEQMEVVLFCRERERRAKRS